MRRSIFLLDRNGAREQFLVCLDRAMDTFGASLRMVVYFELSKSFGVAREDIPSKADVFAKTLEKIFGAGTPVIKRAIVKELEASTGINDLGRRDLATAMSLAYHKKLEEA